MLRNSLGASKSADVKTTPAVAPSGRGRKMSVPPHLTASNRVDAATLRRRQHPRATDTQDLEVTVWQSRCRCIVGRVLNLSETGMLLVGDDADVGDVAAFELKGLELRFAGYAEVAHITGGAMGLHVLGWSGPARRRVQTLIMQRRSGFNSRKFASKVPGEFLG